MLKPYLDFRRYINAGNNKYKTCTDLGLASSAISIGGGMSGLTYERQKAMVTVLKSFNIPIMATGGISIADQAADVLKEGATLIGCATALVRILI